MSQQIQEQQAPAPVYTAQNDPVTALATRYGMLPGELDATLRKTVFRDARSNEEFLALCFIAKEYQLNPLLKEIYAFPSKGGGVVPLVGVDGYISMMHRQPDFDGLEFRYSEETMPVGNAKAAPVWVEAVVFRKNCQRPTVVREYMDECFRGTEPWKTHPRRMLRHKALCQAVRLAFGFSGIYADADEAEPVAVQATVQETKDVNAVLDAAVQAQPKPAPVKTQKPAARKQEKAVFRLEEEPAPAPEPEPAPMPDMSDPRVRANLTEDYLDYVEGQGMDKAAADAVCQGLVDGGAAADMVDAQRIFVTMQYTV